jgi:hypothetical protein
MHRFEGLLSFCRVAMLQEEHPIYLETVAFRKVALFTALQLLLLAVVYGITWAGVAGVAFPIVIIPARQYLMPKLFDAWTLSQLDATEYEAAPPAPGWVVRDAAARAAPAGAAEEYYEGRAALERELVGPTGTKRNITADEARLLFPPQELRPVESMLWTYRCLGCVMAPSSCALSDCVAAGWAACVHTRGGCLCAHRA